MPLISQSDPGSENYGIANVQSVLRQWHDPSLAGYHPEACQKDTVAEDMQSQACSRDDCIINGLQSPEALPCWCATTHGGHHLNLVNHFSICELVKVLVLHHWRYRTPLPCGDYALRQILSLPSPSICLHSCQMPQTWRLGDTMTTKPVDLGYLQNKECQKS